MISQLCEMFGCAPSAGGVLDQDLELCETIMRMRYFAQMYDKLQRGSGDSNMGGGPKDFSEADYEYIAAMYDLAGINPETGKPND